MVTTRKFYNEGQLELIKVLSNTNLPVIITGKSGSGKNYLAKEIKRHCAKSVYYDFPNLIVKDVEINSLPDSLNNTIITTANFNASNVDIPEYFLVQCFEKHGNFTFRVQAKSSKELYPRKINFTDTQRVFVSPNRVDTANAMLTINNSAQEYLSTSITKVDSKDLAENFNDILRGFIRLNALGNGNNIIKAMPIGSVFILDYRKFKELGIIESLVIDFCQIAHKSTIALLINNVTAGFKNDIAYASLYEIRSAIDIVEGGTEK